jgi:predicted nucleotidyltransferase component of viral defense system
MTRKEPPVNLAASIRARLDILRKRRGVDLELLLSEYAIERLLYRLGMSRHADRFVLKGATLFRVWSGDQARATWDLDLLGRDAGDLKEMAALFKELCSLNGEDGIRYPPDEVIAEEIRIPDEFGGVRIRMEAQLGTIRIPVQIDIGFGDAVVPPAELLDFPTLLNLPAPRILAYAKETVVAEKFEAMISKGAANTRMKDFYDINRLSGIFAFEGEALIASIRATFSRRSHRFEAETPIALEPGFLDQPRQKAAWRAFIRRGRLAAETDTGEISKSLREFLLPVWQALRQELPFTQRWRPGGPWSPKEDSHP